MLQKKESVAKRITRAILCAGVPRTNTLHQACEKFKSTYISTRTTRMEALADYQKLSEGEFVDHPKKYSRKETVMMPLKKQFDFYFILIRSEHSHGVLLSNIYQKMRQ